MKKTLKKMSTFFIIFVHLSFIAIAVYELYRIFASSGTEKQPEHFLRFVQAGFGIFALLLPDFLKKRTRMNLPYRITFVYAVFLYMALLLGSLNGYYDKYSDWDTLQHGFSAILIGLLGFSVAANLQENGSEKLHVTPAFSALFSFCLATTIGVFWEFYEFFADSFLGQNTQRFMAEDGTPLIGQEALLDTMGDLIVNCIFAALIAFIGYFSLKKNDGWLDNYLIDFEIQKVKNSEDEAGESN